MLVRTIAHGMNILVIGLLRKGTWNVSNMPMRTAASEISAFASLLQNMGIWNASNMLEIMDAHGVE